MLERCGLRTRLPVAYSRAELAGAPRCVDAAKDVEILVLRHEIERMGSSGPVGFGEPARQDVAGVREAVAADGFAVVPPTFSGTRRAASVEVGDPAVAQRDDMGGEP